MSKVIYGLHTAEVKKIITHREVLAIEQMFQNTFPNERQGCSYFFNEGINRFWISESVNKAGVKKFLHMKINFARTIHVGEYCLMPYTTSNMKKVVKNISELLKQLKLNTVNADFGKWAVERFDSAFDIEIKYPDLYMSLLDKSVDVKTNKRRCKRIPYVPVNPNKCESVRFGNDSYTYNVYIKLAELVNSGISITPELRNEVENIVRIERQNHISAVKQLLPTRTIKDLTTKKVCDAVLRVMIDDIEAFWGKGSYYSSDKLSMEFYGNSEVKTLMKSLGAFTRESLDANYDMYTPEIKEMYQNYGILPTGISKTDVTRYQVDKMEGLYDMVTVHYTVTKKRTYSIFAVPHIASDGRYKANISLHKINETRHIPVSVAGRTIEEYEEKVWNELQEAYKTNVKYHCSNGNAIPDLLHKSATDILRFRKVVRTKAVKSVVSDYIKSANLRQYED